MNLDNIKVDEGQADVMFSDPNGKDVWYEVVDFSSFLNAIIEFLKKILTFEFDF